METTTENTDGTTYYNDKHLSGLIELQESGTDCNVILKISETKISAHKIVLAGASPYFRSMFYGNFPESLSKEVELRELDPQGVQELVTYIYTGTININSENADRILETANYFQITWVQEKCCEYLEKNLKPDNCVKTWKLARNFMCNGMENISHKWILTNLSKLNNDEDFLNLSGEDIMELLKVNNDYFRTNDSFVELAFSWVNYDVENRQDELLNILNRIPAENISDSFLIKNISNYSIVTSNDNCNKWQLRIYQEKLRNKNRLLHPETVFIFDRLLRNFYSYDMDAEILSCMPQIPKYLQEYNCVSYKNAIYAVGRTIHKTKGQCFRYSHSECGWHYSFKHNHPPLPGVAIFQDMLLILGGAGSRRCSTYNFHTGDLDVPDPNWRQMDYYRCHPGLVVLDNAIYACGGFGTNTVEMLDPREGYWDEMESMSSGGGYCSSVSQMSSIFCISNFCTKFEVYDIRNGQWTILAPPFEEAINNNEGELFIHDNKIYLMHSSKIYQYDLKDNLWNLAYSLPSLIKAPIVVSYK